MVVKNRQETCTLGGLGKQLLEYDLFKVLVPRHDLFYHWIQNKAKESQKA